FGFESNSDAFYDAEINANRNKVRNIKFSVQDLNKKICMNGFKLEDGNITMILDPPRAGLSSNVIDFIKSAKPERIIYISCNPATQARDLLELILNYQVVLIQPIDLFPHTYHIENLVVLEKI
ncbi:MAG: 23S rRNA (uracil-5-)-methyltransferase RumA, partial [Ignavibacteria bacterium]|nr:23S rRNA (uracil-5-)-methyltransferase RumA [Ignavibacteria bacterium]